MLDNKKYTGRDRIKASVKKHKENWKAVLLIAENGRRYVSRDQFVTRRTALKHARCWRHEALHTGRITD